MSELPVPRFVFSGRTLAGAPPAGERTVIERPPPGLGRGAHPVPAVAVIGLAALLVVITAVYYVLRLRKRREK